MVGDMQGVDLAELADQAGCTELQRFVTLELAAGGTVAALGRQLEVSERHVRHVRSAALRRMQRYVEDPVGWSEREREVVELREQYINRYGRLQPNAFLWCGQVLGISRQAAAKYYYRAKAKQAAAQRAAEPLDEAA